MRESTKRIVAIFAIKAQDAILQYFARLLALPLVRARCLKILQYGILGFYRKYGNDALCGLTHLGLPVSNEIPIGGVQGAVKQHFERGVLFYDQNHAIDNPPGSGSVYLAHLYSGPGQDPRIAELSAQVADLQKQLNNATGNVALQQALDAANAKLAQIKTLVG